MLKKYKNKYDTKGSTVYEDDLNQAVAEYQRLYKRRFPSISEIADIAIQIGWRPPKKRKNKRCSICQKQWNSKEFYVNQNYCKKCRKEYNKGRHKERNVKRCSICQKQWNREDFCANQHYCKKCRKQYNKDRNNKKGE